MKNELLVAIALTTALSACSPKSESVTTTTENTTNMEETTTPDSTNTPAPVSDVPGDTITTASGLKYIMLHEGTGAKPTPGKSVSVHYTGYLTDGSKFDSSVDRGQPISFAIGKGQVIQGWDEGIMLLKSGSRARLIIPHELGYGAQGYPPVIPPSATLIFDVELVSAE
ncbi:MAG: FKBP-type peptidyl-prolyl cis-trans isomerase [Bacteroidia bacterium]|nr:FKBP-type peptidyl-prolyl cis-trans isomerase [Bacteroidota bacterium]MBP9082171.1 FKBP-type peptidyl-prolyl cis-trans isomerase [Bacteroidia bacterium]MBK7389659.1 FKBP-type peptidyl-prolyl cis-trans isomerase [Bacteroidota bacterium]MBK7970080.1 FKBP-type peptidyl-prolyl cis-trans isomerase [Bacteroidota bacterium]MBK8874016.1 FKBP-type peptidyl-prolyl cis-trans isomerase [Bacteroidota bacterium]